MYDNDIYPQKAGISIFPPVRAENLKVIQFQIAAQFRKAQRILDWRLFRD
jgi:hypothetical protein